MSLTPELKSLVNQSVTCLGEVIKRELGSASFRQIENIRQKMKGLRSASGAHADKELKKLSNQLEKLPSKKQRDIAQSFTLMLELMNACESAYRSFRLQSHPKPVVLGKVSPRAIIYVLTAHPTEARSPQNISIYHQIQDLLIEVLQNSKAKPDVQFSSAQIEQLIHLLEVAFRVSVVRNRVPKVKDEAEHIYSLLFREEILPSVLRWEERGVPFYVRTWVGGDKDGHPGVDERVLLQSLCLSRQKVLSVMQKYLREISETLNLMEDVAALTGELQKIDKQLKNLKIIRTGDARKICEFRRNLEKLKSRYMEELHSLHPNFSFLSQVLHTFPALVVPLELRESSDVLMSTPEVQKLAIGRMLAKVEQISRGGDPKWYARGMIISMTQSIEHIRAVAKLQTKVFGSVRLPIIPLFEQLQALHDSEKITAEMVSDRALHKAARLYWNGFLEIMVGYSDSSKESGALASRLTIAETLPRLEKVCLKAKLKPIFFHGSGGSVDRGGGSIEDQTSWWPHSALSYYKVTVQGEMVERSLATAAIAQSQLNHIVSSAVHGLKKPSRPVRNPALDRFAEKVSHFYREQIQSREFLDAVEAATPYSYLKVLKIGSRPTKRSAVLTVEGLRAIPWVLCWTQTRVLFQTWWGIGSAWELASSEEKKKLKEAFRKELVFQSYVKALGFTLAKIEMPIWKVYLQQSNLTRGEVERVYSEFTEEYHRTLRFFHEVTGQKELTWFRPWLGESIQLRSSMIHPLNLLQILARKNKDIHLLRLTVTGISSGMLTTG